MRFELLGPVEARDESRPIALGGGKPRALLALLLLRAGEVVPVERIVDALWGEGVPETAVKMVQIHVSHLRKALGRDVVTTRAAGYVLDVARHELDLREFEVLAARGRELLHVEPVGAATALGDALAIWRGPALAGVEEPFAALEAGRLEAARVACLEDRLEADLACGRHRELVGELESLAEQFPLRPRPHGQLMLALYRCGRHADALDAYRRHRDALDELGIEPAPQLRELERRVLQQDPSLDTAPVAPAQKPAAPRPLGRPAGGALLERDDVLSALAAAYERAAGGAGRVVLVTGEPGIGKTAVVTRFLTDLDPAARVLLGTCDDLSIPRPLGPFRDLAGSAISPALATALAAGAAPHEIQALLLAELALPPQPTVLVLEDLHWADDATLDAVTVIGRRIGALPALLVLTFRGGEVHPGHRLHAAVGVLGPAQSELIELAALSGEAVASLSPERADEVLAVTGGNPFYVTELLASSTPDLPRSVANAVVGRSSRLSDAARRLLELVSVVPNRVPTSLLDMVLPGWADDAVEPERQELVEVDLAHVRFRHELARHAIRSSLPIAQRRRLHGTILAALVEARADPAEIVHHAEAAGAMDVVADHTLVAARRAAALDSNREAYSHYRRAAELVERLPEPEHAAVFEELASAAYLASQLDEARSASERAITMYRAHGDDLAAGRCKRTLSRFLWFSGESELARQAGLEAVAVLEPLGESAELASAYSHVSQLAMLEQHLDSAIEWGERALDLAARLGDERTRAHALINVGTARMQLDPAETGILVEAHAIADAAGDRHEAARALMNLSGTLLNWVQPEAALRYARQALAYANEHEVDNISEFVAIMVAWLRLRSGAWDEAERLAHEAIAKGTVVQLIADTVLAELTLRRGDPDGPARVAEIASRVAPTGELQRIAPVIVLETELALTHGSPMPTERFRRLLDELHPRAHLLGCVAMEVAAWAAVAGVEVDWDALAPAPFAAMVRRDWLGAAGAFGDVGWPYERALMLSLLGEEAALAEAIGIARRLGAGPLEWRVEGRLRELGLRVPRQGSRNASAGR